MVSVVLRLLPGTRVDLAKAVNALREPRFVTALAFNRLESELRPDEEIVALVTGASGRMVRLFSAMLVITTLRVLEITPRPMSQTCDFAAITLDKVTSVARVRQGMSSLVGTPSSVGLRLTLQGRNLDLNNVDPGDADAFIRAVQTVQLRPAVPTPQLPPPPPGPPAFPPAPATSRVDQLSQLASLLDRGLLTPEEFSTEKALLLST